MKTQQRRTHGDKLGGRWSRGQWVRFGIVALGLWPSALLGCAEGGQTGEPDCVGGGGPIDETEVERILASARSAEGSYEVPIFWLDLKEEADACRGQDYIPCEYPGPDEVLSESVLHLQITAGEEVERQTCGEPQARIFVEMETEDGQLHSSFSTWYGVWEPPDLGHFYGGDVDRPVSPDNAPPASIGLTESGPRGFVEVGGRQGAFPLPSWHACSAQPRVEDVDEPMSLKKVMDVVDSLELTHPDLFEGTKFTIDTAPWRDHACVLRSGGERSANDYKVWVETSLDADSGEPFVGDLDVEESSSCEGCVTVTIDGEKELVEGPLLMSAPEEVDGGTARIQLRLTLQGDELVQGEFEYRAVSNVEDGWEVHHTVEVEP